MLPYVTYFPSIQIHLHAALQPSLADDIRTPLLPAACLPDARMHGIDIIIVISAIMGHSYVHFKAIAALCRNLATAPQP